MADKLKCVLGGRSNTGVRSKEGGVRSGKKPLVLVVVNYEGYIRFYHRMIKAQMQDTIALIIVHSDESAKERFDLLQSGLAAVAVNYRFCPDEPDKGALVGHIVSSGFSGPIIATSSAEDCRKQLRALGCTHDCSPDELFPHKICEVLGLELPDGWKER